MPLSHSDLPPPHPAGAVGSGVPAPAETSQGEEKARVLAEGATGVHVESLALFAEPLYALYDLDAAEAFALKAAPEAADESTVAVVEAARVLWAYFSLPEPERDRRYDALAAFLLGPGYDADDEADLDDLLDRMRAQWDLLDPADREAAEAAEAPTLGFDALLAHPAFAHPAEPAQVGPDAYGPEGLSALDAQALFAQPLLHAAADPEAMERAMERASAYWELAHRTADRADYAERVVYELGRTAEERTRVRREAAEMLERFERLFPEQAATRPS